MCGIFYWMQRRAQPLWNYCLEFRENSSQFFPMTVTFLHFNNVFRSAFVFLRKPPMITLKFFVGVQPLLTKRGNYVVWSFACRVIDWHPMAFEFLSRDVCLFVVLMAWKRPRWLAVEALIAGWLHSDITRLINSACGLHVSPPTCTRQSRGCLYWVVGPSRAIS